MSDVTINGKEIDVELLEELKEVIEKNNEISSMQNNLMLKYTKWLYWLTIGISIVAILQLIAMFIK
ncbi:MAG: hypothetical protein J7K17_03165 [Candidatus Omnitrophica bacterium]|nr:hypothetical protein [Candidatus Omnitrophota bacterium]